jgi:hypothetical protein
MTKDDGILTYIWLKEGWNSLLDNLRYILPAALAFEIAGAAPALLIWKHFDNRWYAIPWEILVGAPLAVGMNLFYINLARNDRADYGDIFRGFTVFPQAVAVSLLYGLIVTTGLVLLVIPGVIWGLSYLFAQYSVLDRKTGIKGSFVYSSGITYGFKDKLLPIASLWLMLEVLAPGIIKADGTLLHMRLVLDLKPWVLTAFILKTLIFLPWLSMAAAKAYVALTKHHDRLSAAQNSGTR